MVQAFGLQPRFRSYKPNYKKKQYVSKARNSVAKAKAKANPTKVIANNYKRSQYNNAIAVRALNLAKRNYVKSFGSEQKQLQILNTKLIPSSTKPLVFDLNNVAGNDSWNKTCVVWQPSSANSLTYVARFQPIENTVGTDHDMWQQNEHFRVNAPEHYAKYAVYNITVDGKVDDVNLRFDFVKCKNQYRHIPTVKEHLMPQAILGLNGLAESPPTNAFNSKYFYRTRKPISFYLNSRPTKTAIVGMDEFVQEIEGTGPFRRQFRLFQRINKHIKEWNDDNRLNEHTGHDDTLTNNESLPSSEHITNVSYASTYNRKISDSEWLVISCNDALTFPVINDRVEINISRMVCWRDKI